MSAFLNYNLESFMRRDITVCTLRLFKLKDHIYILISSKKISVFQQKSIYIKIKKSYQLGLVLLVSLWVAQYKLRY